MDITTYEPMLMKYYTKPRVELITYRRFPTLRLLNKVTDWTGENYEMPIWYESGQAVGHDFSTAQAGKSSAGESKFGRWSLTRSNFYGFAKVNRLTMLASMGDARAFLKHYTEKVDGTLQLMGRELATKVFRTRRTVRGVVSAVGNGDGTNDKVTLSRREDIVHFSLGMRVTFTDTSGGVIIVPDGGVNPVIGKIDRSAGTFNVVNGPGGSAVTLTAAGGLDIDLAAGDLIYRTGDILTFSDNLGIAGFEEWVPSAAPSSTLFYNVNRSLDSDKLGGLRVSGVGFTMEDALIEGSQRAFECGAELTHWVCNPVRFGQLIREMGSKLERDPESTQVLGTRAFKVATNAGDQVLYADPFCQKDIIWGLNEKTWKLVSTRELPHIFDDDFRMLRESSSDDYEVRMGGYGQLGCHTPGENVRIDLV